MQETVIDTHKEYAQRKAGGHHADQDERVEIGGEVPARVPEAGEHCVLQQHDAIVEGHPAAAAALLDVEPAEDVDDPHHHVVDDLFPLGHAEVCLTLDNPEGHDAPVGYDENAKVELVDAGKEGESQGSGCNGEQVPQHLGYSTLVGQGPLVISRVSQYLLVGCQCPGQGHKGGRNGEGCGDRVGMGWAGLGVGPGWVWRGGSGSGPGL